MREYTDLEIRISRDEVRFSIDGDVYSGDPHLTDALLSRLEELRMEGPDTYGEELFQAVFRRAGNANDGYQRARTEVRNNKGRFRLRLALDLNCPELHRLCWEALHDPDPPPHRLAAWSGTPLSRTLDGLGTSPVRAPQLKVLGVVVEPQGLGEGRWERLKPINADVERDTLEKAVEGLDDRLEYVTMDGPATYPEIRDRLQRGGFHVLHLVSHGAFIDEEDRSEGFVILENAEGSVQPVGDVNMAEMIKDLDHLQLVVLAACQSATRSNLDAFLGVAPRMISYGLPAVVAMQDEIEQTSARVFTRAFYDSLARSSDTGGLVDVAVNDAREKLFSYHLLDRPNTWEWVTPVAFLRGDGQLFEPVEAAADTVLGELPPLPAGALPDVPIARIGRRFQPSEPAAPLVTPETDWRLDAFHLVVKKYELDAEEIQTVAWLLMVTRPDADSIDRMAQNLVDTTAIAGKHAELHDKIVQVVNRRAKANRDLLRAV